MRFCTELEAVILNFSPLTVYVVPFFILQRLDRHKCLDVITRATMKGSYTTGTHNQ